MNLEEVKALKESLKVAKDSIGEELKDLRMQQATKEAEVVEIQRQITDKNDQLLTVDLEITDLETAERIMKTGADGEGR